MKKKKKSSHSHLVMGVAAFVTIISTLWFIAESQTQEVFQNSGIPPLVVQQPSHSNREKAQLHVSQGISLESSRGSESISVTRIGHSLNVRIVRTAMGWDNGLFVSDE